MGYCGLNIVHVGVGTAGLRAGLHWASHLEELEVVSAAAVDHDCIEAKNALTCPEYRGFEGSPKAEAFALLTHRQCGVRPRPVTARVETVDWSQLVTPELLTVVVAGLDVWESRLELCQRLRDLEAGDTVLVSIGLDRGLASVAVLGCDYAHPCEACGLPALGGPEPCAAHDADGRLVRGSLRAEAQAAAELVLDIARLAGGAVRPAGAPASHLQRLWLNTRTVLVLEGGGSRARRYTRRIDAVDGCFGPHYPVPLGGAGRRGTT